MDLSLVVSNSHYAKSQLVILLPVGVFTMLCSFYCFFPLFQWHAWKLALSAKCIDHYKKTLTFFFTSVHRSFVHFYNTMVKCHWRSEPTSTICNNPCISILSYWHKLSYCVKTIRTDVLLKTSPTFCKSVLPAFLKKPWRRLTVQNNCYQSLPSELCYRTTC